MTTPRLRPAFLVWATVAALASACAGQQPRPRVLPPVPEVTGTAIVRTAESLLGAPYREGGALPDGFDCSGLVNYVFARQGIAVPRDVRRQAAAGVPVARADIRPGDLLFFSTTGSGPTHVAIAIDGRRFIHAPKSGAAVRVESLTLSYWAKRLLEARRIPQS
jgi:murein DD-endopeptidase